MTTKPTPQSCSSSKEVGISPAAAHDLIVHRYFAFHITGLDDAAVREVLRKHGAVVTMPCGVSVEAGIVDQRCPNSGNCAAGITEECWVMKRSATGARQ